MLRHLCNIGGFLGGACAARPHDIPVRAADEYTAHAKTGALSAGADLFDNAYKCNHAFGENISRTFTPVQVVLENQADDKFLVDRTETVLDCDDGSTLEPVGSAAVYSEYHTNLLAVAEAEHNAAKRADWAEKEWPKQLIVRPNQRVGGFLFFRGKCSGQSRAIRLTADNLKSDERVAIEIPLH
jgi:hypothetical protein